MSTFLEIQNRVARRVIDLPSQVTAEVPTLINEAITELQRDHNFKVMEATVVGTTTVDTNTLVAVPSDFKEYRKQPYAITDLGSIMKLKVAADVADLPPDIQNSDIGRPLVVIQGISNFTVYPTADGNSDYSNGEYRITIPYWKYLTALVADTDTNWFTVNAEKFIVEWATAEAHYLDWDDERMAIAIQKCEVQRQKIIVQDKRFRLSGVTEMAYHKNAYDSNLRI